MPSHDRSPSTAHHRWEHHDELLPVDPDLAPDDPGEPSLAHHPIPHIHRGRQHAVATAIGGGGFIGTLARYGVGMAWHTPSGRFPWATFAINTSGALLLGIVLTLLLERGRTMRHLRYLRPFVCVGVLGAWTTMSALAVETDLLVKDGHAGTAAAYLVTTVVAGTLLSWVGIATGRALSAQGVSCSSR